MANLKVKIETNKTTNNSTVQLIFTNDIEKEEIINVMKSIFDLEMITAEITQQFTTTTILIKTENMEKIQIMRSGLIRIFRKTSNTPDINLN